MGGNCVRVFLSFGSFYQEEGVVSEEGLKKLDQFLALAEEAGVYVHPTGPDMWEGHPSWVGRDRFADERMLAALETFWKVVAARYKGRNVIFAYDLLNEPMVPWNTPALQTRWQRWVVERYGSVQKAAEAWKMPADAFAAGAVPIPAAKDQAGNAMLLDYQHCREDVADEWTRRQAAAIKSADPNALVTVGFIQWAVPVVMPRVDMYAGFRPERQAKYLDFLEVHFYPLERGAYEYGNAEQELRNLAYLDAVVREVARPGKPVVLAEFGWHGGGSFPMGNRLSKPGSEEDQARWCGQVVQTTAPVVAGWLNWGFYDHPQAKDVSVWTGLLRVDGTEKAWGRRFRELARERATERRSDGATEGGGRRPALPWDECITSSKTADQSREEYIKAFAAEK
jgi:hypothetical protein